MARVQHRRAAKDYPQQGILKGDMYYFAQVKTGPRSSRTIRSKRPIPRSQLTSSEFLSTAYGIDEQLEDACTVDDIREAVTALEELRDGAQERLDNMPDGLQQGDTGQMLQERIDETESWISSLEDAANELESSEDDDGERTDEQNDELRDRVREALSNVSCPF